jgi:hypothetical protein
MASCHSAAYKYFASETNKSVLNWTLSMSASMKNPIAQKYHAKCCQAECRMLWRVCIRQFNLKGHLHEQPKSVQFLPYDQFCQAIRPIFVSIGPTDITLHKIGQRDRKIPISKSVGEPGKIGQTAWQNQSDVTKIGSATVRVNGA